MKTYQDLQNATDKEAFILEAIREHRASVMYQIAVDAEEYDRKRNVTILKYQKLLYTLSGQAVLDNFSANHKVVSGFFNHFITQENQYSLGNGVTLEKESNKAKLGKKFDTRLQEAGRGALVQGVSFGFWNFDHLEVFKLTEFVPLRDEEDGALKAGIRFWQIDAGRPLRATLYEMDGFTEYIKGKNDSNLTVSKSKEGYKTITTQSKADGILSVEWKNYPGFPIVPLWGNPHHQSELVGLREGIDCYDLIKSGFANDLDDASMIYWTLENAGGMDDVDLAKFVERMRVVKAAVVSEQNEAKAEAHTLEVPYQSRTAYLERLEHDLYRDAEMLDVNSLSAAQKTTVEIEAAYQAQDNKADQYEYCIIEFLEGIFELAGIEDTPTFTRSKITNRNDQMQTLMMAAQYLDDEYIVKKVCAILGDPDEAKGILERLDNMEQKRMPDEPEGQEELIQPDNQKEDEKNEV